MRKVSVVIPTKNGGAIFRETLEALKNQQYEGQIELVIIDSGSTDDTIDIAKRYGAVVESIHPREFNHGLTRNRGIEMASGEIIVIMSQDAVPGDEYLVKNFVAAFDDPKVAGAYARQVPRDDADILTKRNLNRWLTGRKTEEIRWISDWDEYQKLSPLQRHHFYNFDDVCSAVRKSVWCQIPFRANDFGEDIDWSQQVLEAGWKIAYWPRSYVIHSHNRSIMYDYTRNRQTFKKLYQQYGLYFVASRQQVLRLAMQTTIRDWKYVLQHEKNSLRLMKMILWIPFLSMATIFGQYKGTMDAMKEEVSTKEARGDVK